MKGVREKMGGVHVRNRKGDIVKEDGGTLVRLDPDGVTPIYGISAHGNKKISGLWNDLGNKGPSPHHAEGHAFGQLFFGTGKRPGSAKLYVDNPNNLVCGNCKGPGGIRRFMEATGVNKLDVYLPDGTGIRYNGWKEGVKFNWK